MLLGSPCSCWCAPRVPQGRGLWCCCTGGGEEQGAELSHSQQDGWALALVTNPEMTLMKADPCHAGGHVPVTALALNMLLISPRLWVGRADS